jgi:hypothetical protein
MTEQNKYRPATLPFRVWCKCSHISGQHAAKYPHKCAVDGGCEHDCQGFEEMSPNETVSRSHRR